MTLDFADNIIQFLDLNFAFYYYRSAKRVFANRESIPFIKNCHAFELKIKALMLCKLNN